MSSLSYHIITNSKDVEGCDIIFDLVALQSAWTGCSVKYICPESCSPRPYVSIPMNWLVDEKLLYTENILLTCSMTSFDILDNLQNYNVRKHDVNMLTFLVKHISRRRIQECNEREFWPRRHEKSNDVSGPGEKFYSFDRLFSVRLLYGDIMVG
jgi:hypothetical protein